MSRYQVNQIADWFLASIDREAGDTISHLKLQKLMYYAQAWSLALNSSGLFEEDFEAWTHGPVLPSLWERFKAFDQDSIPLTAINSTPEILTEDENLLSDILNSYGDLSAKHLEELTHSETPWREARGNLPIEMASHNIISQKMMQAYYRKRYEEQDDE
ncbi:MAG: hypothetical protein DRR16_14265 [Candidatus Parabeggiatoa sp. nov. 3]|nr:MAG: hypothetical protein DRR00_10120 [Gammaproteobacteria bacterium]RKZ68482.1 MAG: hypothetical protein DRQ99_03670 [Gammaproteobacteria bacterium]RKZ84599.1 MAG: hypothetical protein DRR16_14265 [Gammaproteobacteria bacterium]